MCYPAPGPMCGEHAAKKLAFAEFEGDDSNIAYAQVEFDFTEEGIAAVRETNPELAARLQARREERIQEYEDSVSIEPKSIARFVLSKRIALAESEDTDPEWLRILTMTGKTNVHRLLASNPGTPSSSLIFLAKHWMPDVRRKVAYNPSAPIEALAILVGDGHRDGNSYSIARTASQHPRATRELRDAYQDTSKGLNDEKRGARETYTSYNVEEAFRRFEDANSTFPEETFNPQEAPIAEVTTVQEDLAEPRSSEPLSETEIEQKLAEIRGYLGRWS